ncbi:MAG TPA: WD40 repeat domain-containing protein [Gemmataceae bacterium]|nr:WD40 repeat domain-containing protein [Gemmataceae bacterium]
MLRISLVTLASVALPYSLVAWPVQEPEKIPEAKVYAKLTDVLRSVELHFTPDSKQLLLLRHFSNKNEPVLSLHEVTRRGFAVRDLTPESKELSHSLVGSDLFGKVALASDHYGDLLPAFRKEGVRVALSPTGKVFLTSSLKTVRLWHITNPNNPWLLTGSIKPLGAPLEHAGSVLAAFTKDGKHLLTATLIGGKKPTDKVQYQVQLWDVDSGKQIGEPATGIAPQLLGKSPVMRSLAWSPDEQFFIMSYGVGVGAEARFVHFWNAKTLHPVGEPFSALGSSQHFSQDGKTLLVCSKKAGLSLWDVANRKLISRLSNVIWNPHADNATEKPRCAFHPDGPRILAIHPERHQVQLWDFSTSPPRKKQGLEHSGGRVHEFAISRDGKQAATAAADPHELLVWDLETGKRLLKVPYGPQDGFVRAMEFSPDGRLLATVTERGGVQLWNLALKK